MSSTEGLAILRYELELTAARDSVALGRELLHLELAALREFDARVGRARARRCAALHSAQVTEDAASRCGVSSRSTAIVIQKNRTVAEEASRLIRSIVEEAAPACERVEALAREVRAARHLELKAMIAFSAALEALRGDGTTTRTATRARLQDQIRLVTNELVLEERRAAAIQSGSFDPHYDEWELAIRRARPWL